MRNGAELVAGRFPLRLDEDVYLVADGALPPRSTPEPGSAGLTIELALPPAARRPVFLPGLRSAHGEIGSRLAEIASRRPDEQRIVLAGSDAADWCGMLDREERAFRARATRIRCVKAATRHALFRRVLRGVDFIQSHYEEPLDVAVLAGVSNLSRFHFARLFSIVMDKPPHAFLIGKRVAVARRLLAAGVASGEAAERVGFGSRSTLFRHLRHATLVPHAKPCCR